MIEINVNGTLRATPAGPDEPLGYDVDPGSPEQLTESIREAGIKAE